MSTLGNMKRYVEKISLNQWDKLLILGRRANEIRKFNDARRVKIWSTVTLTKKQQDQIDDFFITNYGEKIPHTWHRHYTAFTGKFDYKYFPELLYIPEFEHFMNGDAKYCEVFSDKNVLPLIAKAVDVKTPNVIFSRTCGLFRDCDYKFISMNDATDILTKAGDVFIKPTVETGSGLNCKIINVNSRDNAAKIFDTLGNDFVVQEIVRCHDDIAKIYAGSVNTFRVISYIWHGQVRITPSLMRIGQGGNYLDNAHAGGMFIAIDDDGALHDKAFTEFNTQFTEHPDSHVKFAGCKIHAFPEVIKAARKLHEAIPQVGVINWDFTIDIDNKPVLLEGNMRSGSIWLSEMSHGRGIFGDDTAEILQYTRRMKRLKLSKRLIHRHEM